MNISLSLISIYNHLITIHLKFLVLILTIICLSCTTTKRFTNEQNGTAETNPNLSNFIRVLLYENESSQHLNIQDEIILTDGIEDLARVKKGNKLILNLNNSEFSLSVNGITFYADSFIVLPALKNGILKIDGNRYRGQLKLFNSNNKIQIVNRISIEDYVKGVMTKEMPAGNGFENYQALKAFSICVRTYALSKLNENKGFFDLYQDTRDQVYDGVDGETDYTNQVVDETKGQIINYHSDLATIFYHSTCGGFTEDVYNVFGKKDISYLQSIEDGKEHYCKISPRYNWEEVYDEKSFLNSLLKSKVISTTDYSIDKVNIKSRLKSGRVNELEIFLIDRNNNIKQLFLYKNDIRYKLRSRDGKSILKSTLFDIKIDSTKNVIITGKGNGHGVGLCQWGAIGQSREKIDYKKILEHYFPGTRIEKIYD